MKMTNPYRKLTADEKKVIRLLNKIKQLYDEGDVQMSLFGSAGGTLYALLEGGYRYEEIRNFEISVGDICSNRIAFEIGPNIANGGDPNFYPFSKK